MSAVELLSQGRLADAIDAVKNDIRADSAASKHRIFLFQLLCITGDWGKALNQLNVLRDLDAGTLAMANTYQEALNCEALRAEVFRGNRAPMVMGEPDEWIGILFESNKALSEGEPDKAARLREAAFEQAAATPGEIDGEAFEWIADADSRLGPVLEAIINGKYYWVPFNRLSRIVIDPPEDLRDFVWAPAQLTFANGGEQVALLPTRYPGSEASADEQIQLGRATCWEDDGAGGFRGLGQKLFATDAADKSLLEIREILIASEDESHDEVEAD